MATRALPAPLLSRTRELLAKARKQGITNLEIHAATSLRPNWISGVATGTILDPSVRRVQTLHDFLARRLAS